MRATQKSVRQRLREVRQNRQKIRQERAQRSFEQYVRQVKPDFELQWFHEALCSEIQEWAETDDPYVLILQMPPGHAKSTYAKLFCTWFHGVDPDGNVVYTSYGQDLADEHCGDIQQTMFSDEYRECFPDTQLNTRRTVTDKEGRGARRTKDLHEIVGHEGKLSAVGTGGPITGGRYDIVVIDDPLKGPKAASSDMIRNDQWNWYTRVVLTRKRPNRKMRVLLLLTRWHMDDLAGRIQKYQPENCRVVSFEALREDMSDPRDPREEGEALWPAVETKEDLEKLRVLDASGFASLYQQKPVPPGGTIIRASWTEHRWDVLPAQKGRWVWACDPKAGSKDPKSSRAVIQLWFQPESEPGRIYLVDQRKGVWDQPETLAQFELLDKLPLWKKASAKLVEDKADGKAIIATLKKEIPGLIPVPAQGDKVVRAKATTPYWHAGNIWLPKDEHAEWVPEFVNELTLFPGAPHDDQVDAMSIAVWWYFISEEEENDGSYLDAMVS